MTREEVFEAMDLELVSYHQALSARETEELQADGRRECVARTRRAYN